MITEFDANVALMCGIEALTKAVMIGFNVSYAEARMLIHDSLSDTRINILEIIAENYNLNKLT